MLRGARRRDGRHRGDRGGTARPDGPARRRRLLHRDVLRSLAFRAARQRPPDRRDARRDRARLPRQLDVPGVVDEPRRGRRSGRLHDRRADGVRQAVGRSLLPADRAARPGARLGSRESRCAPTPSTRWPRSVRSTSRISTRRTTSTATSRTITSGRRSWRGMRPSTTASRASASTRATRRRRACSTTAGRCPSAFAKVIRDVDAELVVVSYNNESWVAIDELEAAVPGPRRRGGDARVRLASLCRRADRHPQSRRGEGRARCRICATSSTWSARGSERSSTASRTRGTSCGNCRQRRARNRRRVGPR